MITKSHARGLVALTLVSMTTAACGTSGTTGIAWTRTPGTAAQAASAQSAPPCSAKALAIKDQKWGGIWHQYSTGGMSVANRGSHTCEVHAPTSIQARTNSGRTVSFAHPLIGPPTIIMPPGDAFNLSVVTTASCKRPALNSTSFTFKFGSTGLTAKPAKMQVQCGGHLEDFSDQNLVATPTPPASHLQARIEAPKSAAPAKPLRFQVALTNPTSKPISLRPCPYYSVGIKAAPLLTKIWRLNCAGAGNKIAAKSTARFDMVFFTPRVAPSTPAYLTWRLLVPDNASNDKQDASAPITIR